MLIFGASVRAAAASARRAGLHPWCADLFADADLVRLCPEARRVARYPEGFLALMKKAPPGPWMYTGGLENRPALVQALSRTRVLWGNGAEVLRRVRSPREVAACLARAGIASPPTYLPGENLPPGGRYLVKPLNSAGGKGIGFLSPESWLTPGQKNGVYLQQFISGEARSAVFVGDGQGARLLGATRQLVGETWLHARPFQYCGSVGPLVLEPEEAGDLSRLGNVLADGFRLRGLFGVDGVFAEGRFWPVEVNPRYTASVEILERALAFSALAWHRRAFVPDGPEPPGPRISEAVLGKGILFAREPFHFPTGGPWAECLAGKPDSGDLPDFADIPPEGQPIERGWPILTFFARGDSVSGCQQQLRARAADLDRRLSGS